VAQDSGFITVDLSDLYEGQDLSTLIVAEWDKHPNPKAHQLIADRLYDELKAKTDIVPSNGGTNP
jgi:hypothetical protein